MRGSGSEEEEEEDGSEEEEEAEDEPENNIVVDENMENLNEHINKNIEMMVTKVDG